MSDRPLRVLTLTLGSLFEPPWDEQRETIAAGLASFAPDIVCLHEVCQSVWPSRPDGPAAA